MSDDGNDPIPGIITTVVTHSLLRASATVLSLTTALLLVSATGCRTGEDAVEGLRARGANVILVTIDTLRADHLGCYGYPRDTSPNIDAIARRSVVFESAFSPRGLTFPSVASIMTAKYVYSHGLIRMWKTALATPQETLAEVLRDQGLQTAGFSSHPSLNPQTGFAQGFDDYSVFTGANEDQMVEQVGTWIAGHQEAPFFVWVHFFGPHSPYQSPPPWNDAFTNPGYDGPFDGSQKQLYDIARTQELSAEDKDHLIALYDGKIKRMDHLVGVMVRDLDALNLRERTLLIVTADHGEELFDHFLYFSHEASVYDGVLRVPLLMSLPGRFPEGLVIRDQIVESVDIMPTVLDVLGIEPSEEVQGRSVLSLVGGAKGEGQQYAYGTLDAAHSILTIRTPRWRYIYNPKRYHPGANLSIQQEELYDIQDDPDAFRNVVREHPDVGAGLRRELLRWKAWTESHKGAQETLNDPEVEAQLRALGYVQDDESVATSDREDRSRSQSRGSRLDRKAKR